MSHRAFAMISIFLASSSAFGQTVSLEALYSPDTGNITMQAVNQDGSPGSLQIATFQFLSPTQFLDGVVANIPASAVSLFTVLNTDESTYFTPARTSAEIYATSFSAPTPLFDSTWDLGNVANTGLNQSQIFSGFTTDPDVSPGGQTLAGKFLYQIQGDSTFYAGDVTAVPEPSAIGAGVLAGLLGVAGLRLRRRQLADHSGRGRA